MQRSWRLMTCLFLTAGWYLCILGPGYAADVEEGFAPLFDGKTLSGWQGNEKLFRVENGAIVAGTLKENVPHNEFLASTKEYGDFELRLDAKLVGKGENAGVQFRSKRIPNHFEVEGYQCDMGVMKGESIWGYLYDESRRRTFLAPVKGQTASPVSAVSVKNGDWNALRIRCVGPKVQIWVNDKPTVDFTEPDEKVVRSGIIALQIHGGPPAEASYRNIRIQVLDKP